MLSAAAAAVSAADVAMIAALRVGFYRIG